MAENLCSILFHFQMEVEEPDSHDGLQQYYVTKIEELQVGLVQIQVVETRTPFL